MPFRRRRRKRFRRLGVVVIIVGVFVLTFAVWLGVVALSSLLKW